MGHFQVPCEFPGVSGHRTTTLKNNDPCLCVFDVDRTLTGYQAAWQSNLDTFFLRHLDHLDIGQDGMID